MEIDRPNEEELLTTRQNLLNGIYSRFLSLPVIDVDIDGDELIGTKFTYHFPKGSTTSGFTDQLSGIHKIDDGKLIITYAKGIHAGRVSLVLNPQTKNVDLKSFTVIQKHSLPSGGEALPGVSNATRPHLHAIDSLLTEIEAKMEADPSMFKNFQVDLTPTEEEKNQKKFQARRLGVALRNDLKIKKAEENAQKKKNGRRK